jgi:hypothetical protein
VRGALAYQHLQRIQTGAAQSTAALAADPSSAAPTLARLAADASEAHQLTSDPVWALASHTPWIGPQLAAFGTVAAASDELLRESLLPLATAAQNVSIDGLRPVGGRLDTSVLAGLVTPAQDAATRAADAAVAVQDIDRTPLIGVVGTAVDRADDLFDRVDRRGHPVAHVAAAARHARSERTADIPGARPEQRRVALAGRHRRRRGGAACR